MSDSLQLHGLQHTRLPCPSLSPGVFSLGQQQGQLKGEKELKIISGALFKMDNQQGPMQMHIG